MCLCYTAEPVAVIFAVLAGMQYHLYKIFTAFSLILKFMEDFAGFLLSTKQLEIHPLKDLYPPPDSLNQTSAFQFIQKSCKLLLRIPLL